MAQEVNGSSNQCDPARRRRKRGIFFFVIALAGLASCSVGALWLRQTRLAQLRTDIPPVPAAVPTPSLRELLENARTQAVAGEFSPLAEFGMLCHANGFFREAELCWRLLIRHRPNEARWHYYLAVLLRTAGDNVAAEKELQLVVAADPTAAPAWLQLAEMKFKSGRHVAAEHDYRRRLELLPDDPYAELGLARIAQSRGRSDETLSRLERILKNHPRFSTAHNLYAELQAAVGREDLADQHRWLGREAGRFREADDPWMMELNARCHEPTRLCHLGVVAFQTGTGDLGRAQFERAIAVAPAEPLGYQMLGELLLNQGAFEASRDVLTKGLAMAQGGAPKPMHYLKLSETCRALARHEDAWNAVQEGLTRHPDSAELYHELGLQLTGRNRPTEASAAYRRALQLNPAHAESDFALALILLEQGRREEAVQALNHARQMQPTYPKALLLLARLEMEAGQIESVGEYLLPLLKANPGVLEIRQITARWRLQAGQAIEQRDPAAAERHYRTGLALLPENPELNAALGVRFLVTDRIAEAIPLLETFQQARPADSQGALFLGQAYVRAGRLQDARRVLSNGLQEAERSGRTATASHFREILSVIP